MRALSSAQSVVPRLPADYHFFAPSVEADVIEAEFRRLLVAPWHLLPYGTAQKYPRINQLTKDVGRGWPHSALSRNATRLTFAYQQLEIPTDVIRAPFEYMIGVIGARASRAAPHTIDELLAIETRIEGEVNDLQIEYLLGGRTGVVRRRLIARLRKNIRILLEWLEALEKEEHDERCGCRVENRQ